MLLFLAVTLERVLQCTENDDVYIMVCGDLNARTGSEQARMEDMRTYVIDDDSEDVEREDVKRSSKDGVINHFGKSLL
jgi:hypothetical protein